MIDRTSQPAWPQPSDRCVPSPAGAIERSGLAYFIALGVLASTIDVEAYIDPGTGSYLFQLAIAGLLAALYTIKRYWHTIRDAVGPLIAKSRAGRSNRSNGGHEGVD